ncbi:MAG: DUF58 domain-containing protein [Chloroflexia bacterium]
MSLIKDEGRRTDDEGVGSEVGRRPSSFVLRPSSIARWFRSLGGRTDVAHAIGGDEGLVVDTELLRKLDRISLSVGHDLIGGLMGEHPANRRTIGIEFADFRPYSVGDDLRRVDWNAYARLGTLHVRQAQAEHDTTLYLLLDASPSMAFGYPSKFMSARRLAASLGYIALAHLDSVVMATPGADEGRTTNDEGGSTTEGQGDNSKLKTQNSKLFAQRFRGRAESGEMFRLLQGLRTRSVSGFDASLAGWAGENAGRAQGRIAVVISDLLLDGWRDGLRALASAGYQTNVMHIVSHDEISPSELGDLELIDSETGERMELYLGREGLAEYGRRVQSWLADTASYCRSQGATYLRVMNDVDIERVLLDTLRRRGVTV